MSPSNLERNVTVISISSVLAYLTRNFKETRNSQVGCWYVWASIVKKWLRPKLVKTQIVEMNFARLRVNQALSGSCDLKILFERKPKSWTLQSILQKLRSLCRVDFLPVDPRFHYRFQARILIHSRRVAVKHSSCFFFLVLILKFPFLW